MNLPDISSEGHNGAFLMASSWNEIRALVVDLDAVGLQLGQSGRMFLSALHEALDNVDAGMVGEVATRTRGDLGNN